jgi:hypothetical protein
MRKQFLLWSTGLLLLLYNGSTAQNQNRMILPSQTLSVSIDRSAKEVYAYLSQPENFPKWGAGFGESIEKTAEKNIWSVRTASGQAKVRFTAQNEYGIADHYVNDGVKPEVYIPLRVLANGSGSEVIFTLFRQPDMTDETYARDRAAVEKDLSTLKQVLESKR